MQRILLYRVYAITGATAESKCENNKLLPSFNALNFFSLFHCFAVTELNQQRFLEVFITKRKFADLFTQFPQRLLYIPRARWLLEARALSSLARGYIEVLDQSLHENLGNHMSNFIQSKSVNNMLA